MGQAKLNRRVMRACIWQCASVNGFGTNYPSRHSQPCQRITKNCPVALCNFGSLPCQKPLKQGWPICERVLVVDSHEALQISAPVSNDGQTPERIQNIVNQLSRLDRLRQADDIVDNSG